MLVFPTHGVDNLLAMEGRTIGSASPARVLAPGRLIFGHVIPRLMPLFIAPIGHKLFNFIRPLLICYAKLNDKS